MAHLAVAARIAVRNNRHHISNKSPIFTSDLQDLKDAFMKNIEIETNPAIRAKYVNQGVICAVCFRKNTMTRRNMPKLFNCSHVICNNCLSTFFSRERKTNPQIAHIYCPAYNDSCLATLNYENYMKPEYSAHHEGFNSPDLEEQFVPCDICCEYFYPDPKGLQVFGCKHFYCRRCTAKYLMTNAIRTKILSISCPDCTSPLEDERVSKILDPVKSARFFSIKRNVQILGKPEFRLCSNTYCNKVLSRPENSKIASCSCKAMTCFECGNSAHFGKACSEALDENFLNYARDNDIRQCPKCKVFVYRTQGCNDVICGNCNTKWCWACDAQYMYWHYSHMNLAACKTVKHKSSNVSIFGHNDVCGVGICLMLLVKLLLLPIILIWNLISYPTMIKKKREAQKKSEIFWGIILLPFSLLYIICELTLSKCSSFSKKKPEKEKKLPKEYSYYLGVSNTQRSVNTLTTQE